MRDSKELPTHMGRTLTNKKLHLARSLKTEFLMSTWGMIFILGLQASGISWHQGSTCWLTLAERCRHTHKKTSLLLVFFIFFHCCSERLIFIALRVSRIFFYLCLHMQKQWGCATECQRHMSQTPVFWTILGRLISSAKQGRLLQRTSPQSGFGLKFGIGSFQNPLTTPL